MVGHSTERCDRCGGTNLARDLALHQNGEAGSIGLPYRVARILVGTEALLADLCLDCGTVARLHVRETERKWLPEKPAPER